MKHPCGLTLYTGTADEDVLVGRWYMQMVADGDLDGLFTRDSRTLGAVFAQVRRPHTLVYARDDDGLWFTVWGVQLLSGTFLGLWVRRDRRRSREALRAVLDALAWYLEALPLVLGVTKQANHLREHRRLGYDVVGKIEGWFDGEDAWIVKLTRERLHATLERYRRRWPWATSPEVAALTNGTAH